MTMDNTEQTLQWLMDQEFNPYQDQEDIEADMPCPRCTGRGSKKRTLRGLRLPKIALLEIQTQKEFCFQKPMRPARRIKPPPPPLSSNSEHIESECNILKPPRGRAQILKERMARLGNRPGNRGSTSNLSCLSSVSSNEATINSPARMSSSSARMSTSSARMSSSSAPVSSNPAFINGSPCRINAKPVCSPSQMRANTDHTRANPRCISDISNSPAREIDSQPKSSQSGGVVIEKSAVVVEKPIQSRSQTASSVVSENAASDVNVSEAEEEETRVSESTASMSPGERYTDNTHNSSTDINAYNLVELVKKHNISTDEESQPVDCHDDEHQNETQCKARTKYTLFQRGFTDDGDPIIFENNVKFNTTEPKFKGFSFNHLKTPETFTKERDFPTLPDAPVICAPPPKEMIEDAPVTFRDLAGAILTDGRLPSSTHQAPGSSSSSGSNQENSGLIQLVAESAGPPAILHISNLPAGKLDKENKTFLFDMLTHYGNILQFDQIVNQDNSLEITVKFSDIEECEFARECLDGQEALYPGYVLEATVEPLEE